MSLYLESIAAVLGINVLLVWSFYLSLRTGLLFMGQVGFMAIGAYASVLFVLVLKWPVAAAIAAAVILAMLIGAALGLTTLRVYGFPLAIASLSVAELVRMTVIVTPQLGGPRGFLGLPQGVTWWQITLCAIALMGILLWFEGSRWGKIGTAIRNDAVAAAAAGVPVDRYKVAVVAASSGFAALSGCFLAFFNSYISPEVFGFDRLVEMLVYAVVGGMTSALGSALGVVFLWTIPEYFRLLGEWRLVVYSLVVIIVVMRFPGGLLEAISKACMRMRRLPASRPVGVASERQGNTRTLRGG